MAMDNVTLTQDSSRKVHIRGIDQAPARLHDGSLDDGSTRVVIMVPGRREWMGIGIQAYIPAHFQVFHRNEVPFDHSKPIHERTIEYRETWKLVDEFPVRSELK